ncbi:FAD/NAD(P)-binding domain-containing protein [Hypoxylon fragiforme]|uniref:FAD/NAD(P)-binding domain-containing protein n=1 Tax=Hypoxylon fragiforme TaxID=63214 RepID=UPI0020C737E3|nr:FAD/NAD(P)-binding domain-containing protein [Hypoxylon fragiforme]KAI2614253.1 FAD/NAD(P)-binding domain-containing protein [Hypoxylon fragiforme]
MLEDFASVQEKYTAEAQKRLRPEGPDQYDTLYESESDRLRHLVDDIWADHAALDARPRPLSSGDSPKFLIVGAGVGGVLAAVRLVQQGISVDQIRIVETAGGVGGNWYWNRYPGIHCDIESYIYLPLVEEMGYIPSHKYSSGVEIRGYLARIMKRYNLEDKILFRAQVKKLEWDDSAHTWKVNITEGRGPRGAQKSTLSITAEFVWLTAGILTSPHVPKLAGVGIQGFQGDLFHTSLWNYEITGGSSQEPFPAMSKLKDKRVGFLGTGATAIQAVPLLAEAAKELYVFQRTPSAVYTRGQKPTDLHEWKTKIAAHPGWQKDRRKNLAMHSSNTVPPGVPNLVDDEWSRLSNYTTLVGGTKHEIVPPEKVQGFIDQLLAEDAEGTARLRARIAAIVKDKETARKLTPWYPSWCKRPTFSDTYLQAFNRPNVHLIDTDGKGIESVTPRGLVANGKEIPLDVLILGTGYRTPAADRADPARRSGVEIIGREGKTIEERWAEKGQATLHGFATNGFPNLFWTTVHQSAVTSNHTYTLSTQAQHIAYIISTAHKQAVANSHHSQAIVEVQVPAQEAWATRIAEGAGHFAAGSVCTPSYLNNEGRKADADASPAEVVKGMRMAPYSGGILKYERLLEEWREEGGLEGLEVTFV